jgi:6-phosphofructokinase 1
LELTLVKNIFYAQSGGVTAVINATACGVIETARKSRKIGKVYAGKNGILGALREELIDTSRESARDIAALRHTPSGAFGSCRYKLKSPGENLAEYRRLVEVFEAHNIGYFFYNGGGDSQDTANKVSRLSLQMGHPITCIGIPKTVDNDLPVTDTCPGFGSVAKYVAVSTMEAGLDVASMAESSTKIFVLEVMGRHAGWIAAAAGLAKQSNNAPPHVILFPEIAFDKARFLGRVKKTVEKVGYCVVVASEGAQFANGTFLADAGTKDAFGHTQLGGVAPALVDMIKSKHGYKCHWSVADYLQRAARHIASETDVKQAYEVGAAAVRFALAGKNAVMPVIVRKSSRPYRWVIGEAPLSKIANVEKMMPRSFITRDGFGITGKAREYLMPLIKGEDYPPYKDGLPQYVKLKNQLVRKKLGAFEPNK